MRATGGILLIVFLLTLRFSFGQEENSSVLDKKISIEAQQESIASILDKIASQAHVYFSYDPILTGANRRIDASFSEKSIREILDILLEGKFTYRMLDNQVVITSPDSLTMAGVEDSSMMKPQQTIIFRGKVIDFAEKDALPFTSISLQKSNMGTISNMEGNFEFKIPGNRMQDTVVFSCLGYKPFRIPVSEIMNEPVIIYLQPANFQLEEIKVVYLSPEEILRRMESKISINYPSEPEIMTSFYREVLRQDDEYIDVAEAVIDIRKASYDNLLTEDKVKFIKGRKSMNVQPFQFVDFKIQGGPYYITKLDVIKTMDTFLDPEYLQYYKYSLDQVIEQDNRSTFVISFKPKEKVEEVYYQGKLYVDMSTFALVKAEFEMSRSGLRQARYTLIQKKPKDFLVRPVRVLYQVSYRKSDTNWHLNNAMASIKFKVRSKKDKINSEFHSVSELLVTDFKPEEKGQFKRNDLFGSRDIFTEMITNVDENFWGDYNIIVPSEDLRNTLKKYQLQNDSLFNLNITTGK